MYSLWLLDRFRARVSRRIAMRDRNVSSGVASPVRDRPGSVCPVVLSSCQMSAIEMYRMYREGKGLYFIDRKSHRRPSADLM